VPSGLRGRDLGPLMRGQAALRVDGIYSEALYPRYHFGWSELFALTDDRYRYIKAPRDELYDLQRDPGERTNLVAERGQAVAAMRSGLDALVAGRDVDQPGAVSAEDRQRLAALGYIGAQAAAAPAPGSTLPDPKDMAPVLKKYRGAIESIGAQRLDEAAVALREIVAANPSMADVWSQYASVLLRLGRDEEALAAYKGMIRTHPDEPAALLGAASVLLALGRLDEARGHAELALKNAPATAHEALANIALAKHDDREALNQAALSEQADPTLPMVPFTRGMIAYNQQHYADALPDLVKAHALSAQRTVQTTDVAYFIGDSLARLERYKEAEPYLLEEVRLFPSRVRAHEALATLYQAMDRPADAERSITDWLAQSPTPVVYRSAAKLFRMFGQPERAADIDARGRARFGGGRL
jgi:tetratricopeptide (TPR) repeat protein